MMPSIRNAAEARDAKELVDKMRECIADLNWLQATASLSLEGARLLLTSFGEESESGALVGCEVLKLRSESPQPALISPLCEVEREMQLGRQLQQLRQ